MRDEPSLAGTVTRFTCNTLFQFVVRIRIAAMQSNMATQAAFVFGYFDAESGPDLFAQGCLQHLVRSCMFILAIPRVELRQLNELCKMELIVAGIDLLIVRLSVVTEFTSSSAQVLGAVHVRGNGSRLHCQRH